MLRNLRIANDSGYVTFRTEAAFIECSFERYKRKKTLWIDRHGYSDSFEDLRLLYNEVEKLLESEAVEIVRLRVMAEVDVEPWQALGFSVEFKSLNEATAEQSIMIKYLQKQSFISRLFKGRS